MPRWHRTACSRAQRPAAREHRSPTVGNAATGRARCRRRARSLVGSASSFSQTDRSRAPLAPAALCGGSLARLPEGIGTVRAPAAPHPESPERSAARARPGFRAPLEDARDQCAPFVGCARARLDGLVRQPRLRARRTHPSAPINARDERARVLVSDAEGLTGAGGRERAGGCLLEGGQQQLADCCPCAVELATAVRADPAGHTPLGPRPTRIVL